MTTKTANIILCAIISISIAIMFFIASIPQTITLFPLLILGAMSVLHWNWTESQGKGDLRFYASAAIAVLLIIHATPISMNKYANR